jgi:hypothetical protein
MTTNSELGRKLSVSKHAMKAYGGDTAHTSLILASDGEEWSVSCSGCTASRHRAPGGLGPRISLNRVAKRYILAGNQIPAAQPIASFTCETTPVFKLRSGRIPQ